MDPPLDVQQQLNASGDDLQNLQGELREAKLEALKRRLVDSFYNEVSHTYGLRPEGRTTIHSSGSTPTVKPSTGPPARAKRSLLLRRRGGWGEIPVSGSVHPGLQIWNGRHVCTAEIIGAH